MTKPMTGTRKEWLAARLELLEAEKELTRRSDELARQRQELPWVRIDKKYRFETDEGSRRRDALHVLFELLQPVRRTHLVVHRRPGRQVLLGLLGFPRAPVEPAEAEVAVGQKRAHLELGGQVHCRTVVCGGRRNVGVGTMRGDVA